MSKLAGLLQQLDYEYVHENDHERRRVHRLMNRYLKGGQIKPFVELALAIDEKFGNFSAHDHGLGPLILAHNRAERVADLAHEFMKCSRGDEVPEIIRNADISYLKIGVGTEMSCLLRPRDFWVTNVRTIWAHLVVQHSGNVPRANDALALYRDSERESEMEYQIWGVLHRDLAPSMRTIAAEGSKAAVAAEFVGADSDYLWADSVANALYEMREEL